MLVVNAANLKKDWDWIVEANKSIGAELIDISDESSLLAVSGPKASKVVQQLTEMPVEDLPYYGFVYGQVLDIPEKVLIATTGYTGERTYEIFFRNKCDEPPIAGTRVCRTSPPTRGLLASSEARPAPQ